MALYTVGSIVRNIIVRQKQQKMRFYPVKVAGDSMQPFILTPVNN